jgi:hypothetical protein
MSKTIPQPDAKRYRVVRVTHLDGEREYFLQFKTGFLGRWKFTCGYHRGAPGYFNYQFCSAGNPYYHVEHTIPEIEEEHRSPTLSAYDVASSVDLLKPDPRPIDLTLDVQKVWDALVRHREKGFSPADPYPSVDEALG